MAVTYDENVILTFAERLYRRAATIIVVYALVSAGIGALVVEGVAVAYRIHSGSTNSVAVVIALIGAVLGGMIGSERAFALRLLAQQALCQLQIERNTRGAAVAGRAQPPPIPRATS